MFIPHYRKGNVHGEDISSIIKQGCTLPFGFLLFTNSVNINWNVNATKYQNPQGFLISLQSWWYEAISFCTNFYSKTVLSKHLMNKLDNFPVSFVHQPTLPSQTLDQPLHDYA